MQIQLIRKSRICFSVFFLFLVLFPGCNSQSPANSSPPSFCNAKQIIHEAQFSSNPSLRSDFESITISHLETSSDTASATDSGTAGIDILPFQITNGPKSYRFNLGNIPVSSIALKNNNGDTLVTFHPGDTNILVSLENGNYSLVIENNNSQTALLFIAPESCVNSSALVSPPSSSSSAQLSLSPIEFTYPGVYIQEISAVTTMVGVPTNNTAFIGYVGTGPLNHPVMITSLADYQQTFGAISSQSFLSLAVEQFYKNGGENAYVVGINKSGAVPTAAELIGTETEETGFYALNQIPKLYNLVVFPDMASMNSSEVSVVLQSLLPYLFSNQAYLILDPPADTTSVDSFSSWINQNFANISFSAGWKNVISYFPQIFYQSPSLPNPVQMGSGGIVSALYTVNDQQRGVWTTASGVVSGKILSNITPTLNVTNSIAGSLLFLGVNTIRNLQQNLNVLWGDKTLSREEFYEYIYVGRLLTFIEMTITNSLQWVTFDANDGLLWISVTTDVSNFLQGLFEQGALQGLNASQAFSVACGLGSTMTNQDILNGYLILDTAVAILHPSEFIQLNYTFEIGN